MRRTTLTVTATAALAATLSFGTAYATQASIDGGTPVVNKNGHEVNEHAASGQSRAAEVRERNAAKHPEPTDSPTESPTDVPTTAPSEPPVDPQPNEHAGTHPDTHALPGGTDHGQDGTEHGHGPNEHAGDHPNDHASAAPSTEGS